MGRHMGRHLSGSTNYLHIGTLHILRRCAPSIAGATRSRDLLSGQYELTVQSHVCKVIFLHDASLSKLTYHHSLLKDSMLSSGVQD